MALARVTLKRCESFTTRQLSWRRDQSRVLTDADQINYYQQQAEFVVTPIDGVPDVPRPKVAKEAAPMPKPESQPAPVEPPRPKPSIQEAVKKLVVKPELTAAELGQHTKAELLEFGFNEFGVTLGMDKSKSQLIKRILEEQERRRED